MVVTRLPRKTGFAQRHQVNPGVSKYLKTLDSGFDYWRSPVTIDSIRKDIFTFDNEWDGPIPPLMQRSIANAYKAFRLPEPVKMLHLNDVFKYKLQIWTRSPGLPWKSLGYRTKRDVIDERSNRKSIRWFWHRIKNGERIGAPDSCAFVRSHLAKPPEEKVRAVWGYPLSMTLGEAVFAVPLIEAFQKVTSPMAYGYETALGGCKKLHDELSVARCITPFYTALDFSCFDKTVPRNLIHAAFQILSSNIDFCNYRDYGVADAQKNVLMYQYIERYFIHTTIRLANGERYRKCSGVASGSYFTQLIDSVINYILIDWVCNETIHQPPLYIKVLGDDSIFQTPVPLSLEKIDALVSSIGMKVNVKKSICTPQVSQTTFLGYQLNDGTPTKPHARWMAALLYPETPDQSWDDVASRALGLLYACMGTDDAFDSLCRRIISVQPFEIIIDRGISRMLEMIGWTTIPKEPPDHFGFLRRLGWM